MLANGHAISAAGTTDSATARATRFEHVFESERSKAYG